jgi:hypothetical protein
MPEKVDTEEPANGSHEVNANAGGEGHFKPFFDTAIGGAHVVGRQGWWQTKGQLSSLAWRPDGRGPPAPWESSAMKERQLRTS